LEKSNFQSWDDLCDKKKFSTQQICLLQHDVYIWKREYFYTNVECEFSLSMVYSKNFHFHSQNSSLFLSLITSEINFVDDDDDDGDDADWLTVYIGIFVCEWLRSLFKIHIFRGLFNW
jgi:hypothetical protein